MPKITVEIELAEDGTVTVGAEPPDAQGEGTPTGQGDQPGADDKAYMQPAKSVEDALMIAKDLLTNPQAQQAAQQGGFDAVFNQGAMSPADQQGA
jgi:hypothetical protein